MLHSKLAAGVATAALCLTPGFAQRATVDVDKVANWPAPLYWQSPAPSRQADSSGRIAPGEAKPRTETAQINERAVFVAITPCRLVDTRNNGLFPAPSDFGGPAMGAGTTRVFPVPSGSCNLPATAVAYSFNIAVVPTGTTMRWLTAWPDGDTMPTLATLNDKAGVVTSNAAIVAAGTAGAIDIYVEDATDVIIDTNGYYGLPANLPFGGSAAAPALTFGNTTTGLYSAGAGEVGIAAEGTNVATLNSTGLSVPGNLDFGGIVSWSGRTVLQFPGGSSAANLSLGPYTMSFVTHSFGGNTALGYYALSDNQSGMDNTAVGGATLTANNVGAWNTAVGYSGLYFNQGGNNNTAAGAYALGNNTTGSNNTACGSNALAYSNVGSNNTAAGASALGNNITGGGNIAIGYQAASSVSGGSSNNIHIGTRGSAFDNKIIRIGGNTALGDPAAQTAFFTSGIHGVTPGVSGALPVVIDSNGQLGTTSSSRRFKTDIADMADTTETLMSLRPVQFRYIAYGSGAPLQYGLIAEEVAETAPELVAHDANGEVQTVFYDKVNAMLLNQVQTQQREIESQKKQIGDLESRLAELESRLK
jgi:hypothetical protein